MPTLKPNGSLLYQLPSLTSLSRTEVTDLTHSEIKEQEIREEVVALKAASLLIQAFKTSSEICIHINFQKNGFKLENTNF